MSWNEEGNPKSQGNIDIIELHISYVALSLISRLLRIPELWLNSTDTWNICVEKLGNFLGHAGISWLVTIPSPGLIPRPLFFSIKILALGTAFQ